MPSNKIKILSELKKIVTKLKTEKRLIVTTNGVFDILHIGHIRYLQKAKTLGDILIVGINSDPSVKRIKGAKRPINNQQDRAEVLSALECVDYVLIFNEDTPIEWLKEIKPNIHIKGGDYNIEKIVEKDIVEGNGGKVVILPKVPSVSTTDIIKKILSIQK